MPFVVVYLSLGSNLGERCKNISQAQEELARLGVQILRSSSLYETEPQDLTDQPLFLNCVLEARTSFSPLELLQVTQSVEDKLGRDRGGVQKGPRVIDIDILLYGEVLVQDERLTIPHARMQNRRFVLEPLLEIAPDLQRPGTEVLWRNLLTDIKGQGVARVTGKKGNSSL